MKDRRKILNFVWHLGGWIGGEISKTNSEAHQTFVFVYKKMINYFNITDAELSDFDDTITDQECDCLNANSK